MEPILLAEDFSFWDVIWWMLIVFFWTMVLWMFIAVFADIFRRRDHHGWAKAGWILVITALPFFGILIYMIARPAEADMYVPRPAASASSAAEIAQAQQLLQSGAITQQEFEQLKGKALA